MKSNVLISGDIGAGKTRSLITLLPEYTDERGNVQRGVGLETFLLSLEPGWDASIERNLCGAEGMAEGQGIHVHYIPPISVDWLTMQKFAQLTNLMRVEDIQKQQDPQKSKYNTFLKVYEAYFNFTCQRCGKEFGPIDSWDDSRAICTDALTGLTKAAVQCCVGGRPTITLPEYGIIMGNLENLLLKYFGEDDKGPTSVLIAHIDREVSPITGMSSITINTIGQKLAPRIVKMPSEIVLAEKTNEGKYTWSTVAQGVVLKHRRLREANDLAPDFTQLFR